MTLTVVVAKEHIKRGNCNPIFFGSQDSISLAVKEALGIENLAVGAHVIFILQSETAPAIIDLPEAARNEIERFDRTRRAREFTFDLEVPDEIRGQAIG